MRQLIVLCSMGGLCIAGCAEQSDQSATVKLTEENFADEVLQSGKLVVVDFWADWCRPCHQMAPVIEELANDFEGKATVAKLNVDQAETIARNYKIEYLPTVIVFKDGKEIERKVGAGTSKHEFVTMVQELL